MSTESGQIECRIVNLSSSGMALETAGDLDIGRFVHVTTDLGIGTPKIDLDATVVRRELRGDRIVWGISFQELPRHVVSKIETYVCRKKLDEIA